MSRACREFVARLSLLVVAERSVITVAKIGSVFMLGRDLKRFVNVGGGMERPPYLWLSKPRQFDIKSYMFAVAKMAVPRP